MLYGALVCWSDVKANLRVSFVGAMPLCREGAIRLMLI